VDGRLIVNNPDSAVRAAVDGIGIAYTIEAAAELFLRSGQLVRVLEEWSPCFEGLFLYYHGQRQVPAALRALIDMVRVSSASTTSRSTLQNPFRRTGQTRLNERCVHGLPKRAQAAAGFVATYGFTILRGSTMRSNSASVTKPSFNAAALNVMSWSTA